VSAARRTALVLTGLILLSFNLRPAAVSIGPVLEEVRTGLHLSGPEAGLLTSLPVLAFALFGSTGRPPSPWSPSSWGSGVARWCTTARRSWRCRPWPWPGWRPRTC
jgi:hypothetical protein